MYGNFKVLVWITWISCIDIWLWVVGCKKPNPRMNFCMDSSMDFYDFWYGFYMESKKLMVLYGFLGIFMSSKPRV